MIRISRSLPAVAAFTTALLLGWWASAVFISYRVNAAPASSGGVMFTALHTYFMSPTGSDSNDGLTPVKAWATPNHSVVCGDVIVAAAGTYRAFNTRIGTP